ncbi:uncharacterized protein PSANT_04143 [Moesziomyces antarcticus]|uniref:Uncharacterized protein n=1 Tax=Pseudozyma antarctica TaxID=84753 RepID=A0A5C3FSC5_PSEA2|nr:uncharacterized protein PSANT_04143 [Moesziomyces antarcticus]
MISKSLCALGLASLFASALADDPMAGFATDDNTVNQYCNINTAPQEENFVCFRYSGNIRDHMASTDPSVHGYVNAAGSKVSTLDSGGETREYEGCPWSEPILIF